MLASQLSRGSEGQPPALLTAESLPLELRQWVVDPSELEYIRWPNGSRREVGNGSGGAGRCMHRGGQ